MWHSRLHVEGIACVAVLARSVLSASVGRGVAGRMQHPTSTNEREREQLHQLWLSATSRSSHSVVAAAIFHALRSRPLVPVAVSLSRPMCDVG